MEKNNDNLEETIRDIEDNIGNRSIDLKEGNYNVLHFSNSIPEIFKNEIQSKVEFFNKNIENLNKTKDSIGILNKKLDSLNSGTFSKLFQSSKIKELEDDISSYYIVLNKIKKSLDQNKIRLPEKFATEDSSLAKTYSAFIETDYNWFLIDKLRYKIFNNSDHLDIISNQTILSFFAPLVDIKVYLFNSYFIVKQKDNLSFYLNSDLSIKYTESNYIEQEYNDKNNSKIVKETWLHTNNNGSKNQRIKYNPSIPVRLYSNIFIQLAKDSFHIISSNSKLAFGFLNELNNIINLDKSFKFSLFSYNSISETEYGLLSEKITQIINYSKYLKSDQEFYLYLLNRHNTTNVNDAVLTNILFDLVDSAKKVSNVLDSESKEYFILSLFLVSIIREKIYSYDNIHLLYGEDILKLTKNNINSFLEAIKERDTKNSGLRFTPFLEPFNQEKAKIYSELIHHFLKLICASDGKISDFEQNLLDEITSIKKTEKEEEKNNKGAIHEINDLIGLQSVKNEIQSLINIIKIQDARKKEGLKTNSLNYHLVFTGNPGTGKTTVARIVSKVYKELGILKKGHLVETDRSGLIAEYVGQTAVKVNKLVDSALDGVLFIDEAYAITDSAGNDFGKEAISTLLKRMEDERERLVVIVAGYSDKMNGFLESNPGLSSRFNRFIYFEDYSHEDLNNIFQKFVETNQYELTESAKKSLSSLFKKAIENKDENFGNGRFVRNTFEKTIEKQSNRIANLKELSEEILKKIEQEDIPH